MNNKEQGKLKIRDRTNLRKIYGGVKEGEAFRRRTNREVTQLYKHLSIIQVVQLQRAGWLGDMRRMTEDR